MSSKASGYLFRLGAAICAIMSAVIVSGSLMAQSTGEGSSLSGKVEWSLEAQFSIPEAAKEQAAGERVGDRADALLSKFNSKGLNVEKTVVGGTTYIVKASGNDLVENLRTFLYTGAKPEFDLLGGVTEMEIEGAVPRKDGLVLVLESNLSTGYVWQVARNSGMQQSAPHVYEKHTSGYGFPERQTLRLNPSSGAPVKLVYRRPWEDSSPTQRIKLRLQMLPTTLDLSNPNAPTNPPPSLKGVVHDEAFPDVPADALPAQFDWRDQGIVIPVRDQGSCGSCWAFGTVGIMESSLWRNGAANVDLSEQFLISCNISDWDCSGGWTAHAYHYDTPGKSQTTIGAVYESAKPYRATNGRCGTNYAKPYALTGWQFITGSEYTMPTVDQLKSAILTYGPITAGVCVGAGWGGYSGGIFSADETSTCCNPVSDPCTNHQIILVGWNDADQYWILRNSWGPGWGMGGYMHIKYGTSRVGEGPSWVTADPAFCSYVITSPSTVSFGPGGGSSTVKIGVTGTGCTEPKIAITEGQDWLSYSWLTFKNNSGSLRIKAAATTSSKDRKGTITIGGGPALNVTQKGKPCSFGAFSAPRASYKKNAHTGNTFTVMTRPSDCEWTASTVAPADTWVDITSGSTGTGGDSVIYNVDANPGKTRTGKISMGLTSRTGVTKAFHIIQSNKPE